MALTEEQLSATAMRVAETLQIDITDAEAVEFCRCFLAALPKPEAVGAIETYFAGDDPHLTIPVAPFNRPVWGNGIQPPAGTKLYTEAPIAQPASAPSEQKLVAWNARHLKTGNIYKVIGEAIDATNEHRGQTMVIYQRGGRAFVREAQEFMDKFEATDEIAAPQPDYKAQRDELMEALGIAQATINCAGISTPKIVCDAVEKYAAIASVKGG